MNRDHRIAFRVDDDERAMIKAIAKKLGCSESAAMRIVVREFGKAMGIAPGKAQIRVTVETVGELEY